MTEVTGLDVSVWSHTFSPQATGVVWSTFVPDLTSLEKANDLLVRDARYLELFEQGRSYILPGSIEDGLEVLLHGSPPPAESTYVAVVRMTMVISGLAPGHPARHRDRTARGEADRGHRRLAAAGPSAGGGTLPARP